MWPALLAIYVANSPSAAASFRRDDEVGLSSSSAVTSSTRHSMSSTASGALPCHSNHLIRSSAAALASAVAASVRALLIICPSTVSRRATWNQSNTCSASGAMFCCRRRSVSAPSDKKATGAVTRTEFGRLQLEVPVFGLRRGGVSPRLERFFSEDAERAAGCEMALNVEGVVDGGVNRQEALG